MKRWLSYLFSLLAASAIAYAPTPKLVLPDSPSSVFHRNYRYDANDNVTNIVESGKTNAWTFDAYDRVQSYRDADGNLIQYRYDANGNVTNLIYPGNRVVAYAYDSLNRLTNVTDWANRKTAIEYNLASRVRKITRPNGTVRTIDYDAASQTTNIWEKTATGTPIALFKLNWNAAARVAWEFAAPLPPAYTPPVRVMHYNADNQLTNLNGQVLSYDLDGNLTSGPLTNDTLVSYTFDARNRLLAVGGLQYGYDPAGNRVAITNGANVTRFVVNPNAALSQVLMRVRSGVTNYYIYGLGLLYEVTETATSTNTAYYHYDYRGSTVALTDHASRITDRVNYSSYATITHRTGTNDTPFLFNGRYGVQTDPNGLLHMRARFYNPYICRFINPDPIGFSGGLNFYAYADGNPVSMIDPFGLCAVGEGGWGSQFAGWIDRNVTGPLNSVSTGSTLANWGAYNVGSVVGGFADLFRLGEGTANAIYNAQDGWDVAIGITSDVGRAAGISLIAGGGLQATVGRVGTAATPASTPIGRSGQPLNVSTANGIPANTPTTIGGRSYTGHALDGMQADGIMPSVVQNTISRGTTIPGKNPGTTAHFDPVNNVTVITDAASGRVVTVSRGQIRQ